MVDSERGGLYREMEFKLLKVMVMKDFMLLDVNFVCSWGGGR